MATEIRNEFHPDYASHPGETLLETIETLGMKQTELARRMGRSKVELSRIIAGKAGVTPETALQLERALGIAASFWIALQCNFDEIAARKRERERLTAEIGWLKRVPYWKMVRLGWIDDAANPVDRLRKVLDFYGVTSPKEWASFWSQAEVQFKMSRAFTPDCYALSAWLRQGERQAVPIACEPYDESRFRAALKQSRLLTRESPNVFQSRLAELCSVAGVAVAFVPELAGIRASGATRWLNPTKALLQLCLRYKTDDHLWFTFFHEAGHILLHGKRETFFDTTPWEDTKGNEKEEEANRFASDLLIPSESYRRFADAPFFSKIAIAEFAREIGVAPGIVVGRLQHDKRLPLTHCNDLKRHFKWASSSEESSG
jgi:addiction module HigA family antidote